MAKKIKITASGGKDAADFTDCYFLPTNVSGKYILFGKDDLPIVTTPMPVTTNTSFTFVSADTFTWTIPDPNNPSGPFAISGSGTTATASGSWRNNDPSFTADPGNDPTGESGTFQATANFEEGSEEEAASAATA